MSKKPAALPVFGDAYLADTMHLSLEEHGAYFLLMLAAWRNDKCALPDDDVKLARICRCSTKRFKSIRDNVLEMWDLTPDGWVQKRLKKEHEYVSAKSAHNKRAAEARWNTQTIENIEDDECERISECNAPPPPPTSEPKGSSDDKASPSSPARPQQPVDEAVADWNAVAARAEWPACQKISDARRKALSARLREEGIDGWRAALNRAASSPFLGGAPPPQWFTFDWLIKAGNFLKVVEGNYDRSGSHGNNRNGSNNRSGRTDGFSSVLRDVAGRETHDPYADDGRGMPSFEGMG